MGFIRRDFKDNLYAPCFWKHFLSIVFYSEIQNYYIYLFKDLENIFLEKSVNFIYNTYKYHQKNNLKAAVRNVTFITQFALRY